jgi:hypothetical protein
MVYYQTIKGKRHKRDTPRFRPSTCLECHAPMEIKRRGRPRHFCSPRCRQRKSRRYNYHGYIIPRRQRLAWNKAGRTLRQWEHSGRYDDTRTAERPSAPSLRWRLQFYISRGIPLPICHTCNRLYVQGEGVGKGYCSKDCNREGRKTLEAVAVGVERYADSLGPVVQMRMRLGLELKACAHCSRPFSPNDKRRKYCNDKCRKAAWWQRNPHWACKVCGSACKGQRHTCSQACEQRLNHLTGQFCFRCDHAVKPGNEVLPAGDTRIPDRKGSRFDGKPVIFSSYRCRDALGWSPIRKICDECRESYYPEDQVRQSTQRYCSERCRDRHNGRLTDARRRMGPVILNCKWCGNAIPKPSARQHYCTPECRHEASKQSDRERHRARRSSTALPS